MKIKSILKRIAASVMAAAVIANTGVLSAIPSFAAESSVMGTNQYSGGVSGGATLTTGQTYTLGGYSWVVAEQGPGYAVLQANKKITIGSWPGYKMAKFGNGADYTLNIDGQDISEYDDKTKTLYQSIKAAEKSTSYGKGLYLISIDKLGVDSSRKPKNAQSSGNYSSPLSNAASGSCVWTGTYYRNDYAGTGYSKNQAYGIFSDGKIVGNLSKDYGYTQLSSLGIAPAFNLDTSKVTLSGSDLSVVTFTDSTGISATQAITSLTAGQTKALNQVITGVKYTGGTNNGRSASYKITSDYGTISGTNWTIPSSNASKTATLTITETGSGKKFSTKKTVSISPDVSGITVTQGTMSVVEGASTPLSSLFSYVKYSNNTNANYTVSVQTTNGGSISGSNYVAPTGINNNKQVTLLVKDNTYNYSVQKNITVVPRTAKKIEVSKKATFKAAIMEGSTVDFAPLIDVIGYDNGDQSDGTISSYTMYVDKGTMDGTVYTAPKDLNYATTVTVTVTAKGAAGGVSYDGKIAQFPVTISLDPNGGIENAVGFDANVWYSYNDPATGINWMYKLNSVGDIIGLYTENTDISGLIDAGNCLNVPATVCGRTVRAIGGGYEDRPFILPSLQGWTSISFPASLEVINDYAFMGTTASAKISIPSTVQAVGIKSFYQSNVTGASFNDFSGTIGSYAFGSTPNMESLTIRGGLDGIILSNMAFADSALTDVSMTGNVTLNKKVFRNNTKLKRVSLNGDIDIHEYAFAEAAVDTLNINGNVNIGSYAFDKCTQLKQLYLPEGTTLSEYAFNECSGLVSLETGCDLPSHSFEGTGKITRLILDEGCNSIAYDWEGNVTSFDGDTVSAVVQKDSYARQYGYKEYTNPGRTIYALSSGILYHFGDGLSCLGASGTVQLYIPYDKDYTTSSENTSGSDKALLGMSLFDNASYNPVMNAGSKTSVMVTPVGSIETLMQNSDVLTDDDTEKVQTGITAHYNGTILTTKDIDKEKMKVKKMYGAEEGDAYDADSFYVIRTSEFNSALASEDGITEEKVASYEPITATEDDLKTGQVSGTISATVVVFYEKDGKADFFATPVSIRVEEYSAKSYIEQKYGSYDAVAAAFVEYENRIKELEDALGSIDVDSIETLTKELASTRAQYLELVEILSDFVKSNTADSSGFFGTVEDEEGNITEVVFIDGRATEYEMTDTTDADGNPIYRAHFDADGDGTPEEIYFTVQVDGIHLTDSEGHEVNADGTPVAEGEKGKVYPTSLTNLQRQLTAQIDEMKRRLEECETGLQRIKNEIDNSGINYDELEGDTDYEKIANAISTLSTDLDGAQNELANYQDALKNVYQALMDESLSEEDTKNLTDSLSAINKKISGLKETIATAEENLENAKQELEKANGDVSELKEQLADKEKDITVLKNQVESLSGLTDNYLLTAKTANALFNANLAEDASKEEIDAAVKEYVNSKLESDYTIKEIQTLLGTTATGNDLVEAVYMALNSKKNESGDSKAEVDYTGYTKDSEVNKDSASYQVGYDKGYAEGKDSGDSKSSYNDGYSDGLKAGKKSIDKSSYYDDGYNDGYSDGIKASNSGSDGSYRSGYNDGLADGKKSVNTDSSYNDGYNKGFNDGVASVDNAGTGADLKAVYDTGFEAGKKSVQATNATQNAVTTNQTATGTASAKKTVTKQIETKTESTTEEAIPIEANPIPMSANNALGTVITMNLPISTEGRELQDAVTKIKNRMNTAAMVVINNGETSSDLTAEQTDHAYKILEYYKNNLNELLELGGDEIADAASDMEKQVTFEIVSAKDVQPSEGQKIAFAEGTNAEVTFTSGEFEDESLYLLIHESTVRPDTYDVMLDHPVEGKLTMSLPDLSPVTIAKVSVGEIEQIESTATDPNNAMQPEEIVEAEDGNPYAAFAYFLIAIAVGLLIVLGIQIKKRGGLPFHRS